MSNLKYTVLLSLNKSKRRSVLVASCFAQSLFVSFRVFKLVSTRLWLSWLRAVSWYKIIFFEKVAACNLIPVVAKTSSSISISLINTEKKHWATLWFECGRRIPVLVNRRYSAHMQREVHSRVLSSFHPDQAHNMDWLPFRYLTTTLSL